jgi:hypothetical protein
MQRSIMIKTLRFTLTLLVVCLSVFHTTTLAETYKWVDSQGVIQYTQSRPPGNVEYSIIGTPGDIDPSHMNARIEQQQKYVEDSIEQKKIFEEEQQLRADEKARREKNCQLGRVRLASWSRPRVQVAQADGSQARATEEERQAQLQKSQDIINEFCD